MTPEEFYIHFQTWMKNLKWGSNSEDENTLFGDCVYVVPDMAAIMPAQAPRPCAFIVEGGESYHSEHPILAAQNFLIVVFQENTISQYGESALLDYSRVANSSEGAGTKSIVRELIEKIEALTELNSEKIVIQPTKAPKPGKVKDNFPLVYQRIDCTTSLLG